MRIETLLAVACSVLMRSAWAQSQGEPRWPMQLPALGGAIADPVDGRDWTVVTRIDVDSLSVIATAPGGVLAVTMRRPRRGQPTCEGLVSQLLHTDALLPFRAANPAVFRNWRWEPMVFQQSNPTHDAEFGCLRVGNDVWLASAIAQPRAGVALSDAGNMANALGRALASATTRRGYPVLLAVSGLELDDLGDGGTWLYLGRASGFPVASDAVTSSSGDAGGVTLTVARRHGSCVEAWEVLRRGLASEGTLVDRPGYVPAAFGPRVRRIPMEDRLREVYCVGTPPGALLVTAVFRSTDGEAMTRLAPMLRALVAAATEVDLGASSGSH